MGTGALQRARSGEPARTRTERRVPPLDPVDTCAVPLPPPLPHIPPMLATPGPLPPIAQEAWGPVLLPVALRLVDLAPAAVTDRAGEAVAGP